MGEIRQGEGEGGERGRRQDAVEQPVGDDANRDGSWRRQRQEQGRQEQEQKLVELVGRAREQKLVQLVCIISSIIASTLQMNVVTVSFC